MRNFVTFRLGDNDFSNSMLLAMEFMNQQYSNTLQNGDLETIKKMMVTLILSYSLVHNLSYGAKYSDDHIKDISRYLEYFNNATVTDDKESTQWDCDYGSVSIDLHLGTIWTH